MLSIPNPSSINEYISAASQEETLSRLIHAIEAEGMRIFARIDHAASAHGVGLAMRPSVVLMYGHPRGGTPIMQATPAAALELPLRVLVHEGDDGRALVSFHPIAPLLREAGVDESLATRLEPAQKILLKALA